MKKSDLKTGMKIVTREARGYIVFLNTDLEKNPINNFVLSSQGWNDLDSYDNDLINCNGNIEFDVFEIYKPNYSSSIKRTLSSDFSRSDDWTLIWARNNEKNKFEEKIAELESQLNDLKVEFYSKFK